MSNHLSRNELDLHRGTFEGSVEQMAKHVREEHGVEVPDDLARGLDQGSWSRVDDLHVAAHVGRIGHQHGQGAAQDTQEAPPVPVPAVDAPASADGPEAPAALACPSCGNVDVTLDYDGVVSISFRNGRVEVVNVAGVTGGLPARLHCADCDAYADAAPMPAVTANRFAAAVDEQITGDPADKLANGFTLLDRRETVPGPRAAVTR